jgi:hypothetical protein
MHTVNQEAIGRKELRDFGLITGGLFALLFGLLFPWLRRYSLPLWPWILCALLSGSALLRPPLLKYVYAGWSQFGQILGWVNSRVVLSVIFYLVIMPMGLLMRLTRGDPMARAFDPDAASYRLQSFKAPVNHIERPF